MFVGHYGPALAIKDARSSIPIWALFIAVQFLDVGWSVLVLCGVEKLPIALWHNFSLWFRAVANHRVKQPLLIKSWSESFNELRSSGHS
jgi:hypothetical protein